MSKSIEFTSDLEFEIHVECSVTNGFPGTSVLSYSGPSPAEPPEIEDFTVYLKRADGSFIDITKALSKNQIENLREEVWQSVKDSEDAAREDADERRYGR